MAPEPAKQNKKAHGQAKAVLSPLNQGGEGRLVTPLIDNVPRSHDIPANL